MSIRSTANIVYRDGTPPNEPFKHEIRNLFGVVEDQVVGVSATAAAAIAAILASKGQPNGLAPLGSDGRVSASYLPAFFLSGLTNKGTWNADTNTPTIPAAGAGNVGWFYIVSEAGSTTIDGESTWEVFDWLISNGTVWQRLDLGEVMSSAMLDLLGRLNSIYYELDDAISGVSHIDTSEDTILVEYAETGERTSWLDGTEDTSDDNGGGDPGGGGGTVAPPSRTLQNYPTGVFVDDVLIDGNHTWHNHCIFSGTNVHRYISSYGRGWGGGAPITDESKADRAALYIRHKLHNTNLWSSTMFGRDIYCHRDADDHDNSAHIPAVSPLAKYRLVVLQAAHNRGNNRLWISPDGDPRNMGAYIDLKQYTATTYNSLHRNPSNEQDLWVWVRSSATGGPWNILRWPNDVVTDQPAQFNQVFRTNVFDAYPLIKSNLDGMWFWWFAHPSSSDNSLRCMFIDWNAALYDYRGGDELTENVFGLGSPVDQATEGHIVWTASGSLSTRLVGGREVEPNLWQFCMIVGTSEALTDARMRLLTISTVGVPILVSDVEMGDAGHAAGGRIHYLAGADIIWKNKAMTFVHLPLTAGAWATATAYTAGRLRHHDGAIYKCISSHTSASDTEPGVGASWEDRWVLLASGIPAATAEGWTAQFVHEVPNAHTETPGAVVETLVEVWQGKVFRPFVRTDYTWNEDHVEQSIGDEVLVQKGIYPYPNSGIHQSVCDHIPLPIAAYQN